MPSASVSRFASALTRPLSHDLRRGTSRQRARLGEVLGQSDRMGTLQIDPTTNAAEAVVDLDAVGHNVRLLRERAGSAQVMAVVKADGYGHGAARVGRAALAAGAAELGVATVNEALALRRDGIIAPVLAWLHAPGFDFAPALNADVQLGVSSVRQLTEVLDAVARTGRTATVTVKVDTGLNRNGIGAVEFPDMLTAL